MKFIRLVPPVGKDSSGGLNPLAPTPHQFPPLVPRLLLLEWVSELLIDIPEEYLQVQSTALAKLE